MKDAYLTEKQKARVERNRAIIAEFKAIMKKNGGSKCAIYEAIAKKYAVTTSTVYSIINRNNLI